MATIDKHSYAHMFGPTIGDRLSLFLFLRESFTYAPVKYLDF